MKKLIQKTFVCLMLLTGMFIHAENIPESPTEQRDLPPPVVTKAPRAHDRQHWQILGWGVWFGIPRKVHRKNVQGVKLGLPVSSGRSIVHGLELAAFCAATDDVFGMQLAPVNVAKRMNGFQWALVNLAEKHSTVFQLGLTNIAVGGIQIGLVNVADHASFQLGLLNFNPQGWLTFFPFFNFSH